MSSRAKTIDVYVDGSCSQAASSGGPGGWAVVIPWIRPGLDDEGGWFDEPCQITDAGGRDATTNNRMEMEAAIRGIIRATSYYGGSIRIFTDSAYIANTVNNRWYDRWRANHWKNADRKRVQNRDLWEVLLYLLEAFDVEVVRIPRCSTPEHERADALAKSEMEKRKAALSIK